MRVALIAASVLVVAVIGFFVLRKDTLAHVRDSLPSDCASISTRPGEPYPNAEKSVTLVCEMAGPGVGYARFPDACSAGRAARQHELRTSLGRAFTCLHGRELVTTSSADYSAKDFAALCARVGGRLVSR